MLETIFAAIRLHIAAKKSKIRAMDAVELTYIQQQPTQYKNDTPNMQEADTETSLLDSGESQHGGQSR